VSSTEVQGTVPANAVSTQGGVSVEVANPAPNGGISNSVTFTVEPIVLYTFPAGLQMISAPNDYSSVPLNEALSVTPVTLAVWNPVSAAYALTPTAPADSLDPGTGYWVRFTSAANLYDVGVALASGPYYQIQLEEGWNMVGTPYLQSTPITDLEIVNEQGGTAPFSNAANEGEISGTLFSYGPASTAYVAHSATDSIQPFAGYWVYADQPVLLQIPAP